MKSLLIVCSYHHNNTEKITLIFVKGLNTQIKKPHRLSKKTFRSMIMSELKPIQEIRKIKYQALVQALGPIDVSRYMQSCEGGFGDYTKERKDSRNHEDSDFFFKIKK